MAIHLPWNTTPNPDLFHCIYAVNMGSWNGKWVQLLMGLAVRQLGFALDHATWVIAQQKRNSKVRLVQFRSFNQIISFYSFALVCLDLLLLPPPFNAAASAAAFW